MRQMSGLIKAKKFMLRTAKAVKEGVQRFRDNKFLTLTYLPLFAVVEIEVRTEPEMVF